MDRHEKISRLRLIRSPKIGPVTFNALIRRFGTASDAIAAIPDLNKRSGIKSVLISQTQAEDEIANTEKIGAEIIVRGEHSYPSAFMRFEDAPGCITIRGHIHLCEKPGLAMVGSRNASANAITVAEKISMELTRHRFSIVSGLARGIDAASYRGALAEGTIAVIAGGIDQIYPKENAKLHEQIAEIGLIMTEMPFGLEPSARFFPIRNRLIASLSLGVLVVEANAASGSLITAKEAGDRGLEVMAIPGSPLDPRAKGCNDLIRDGAHLIQETSDIIAILNNPDLRSKDQSDFFDPVHYPPLQTHEELEDARKILTQYLSFTATEVDELIRQCHLSASVVQSVLLQMELDGEIVRVLGNKVYRVLQSR